MTTEQNNLLIIEPSDELKFYQPFVAGCQTTLAVTNPTPYTVYFKLKTTASQRYCVKPKMGIIPPMGKSTINFKLKVTVTDLSSVEEDKFKLLYFEHSSDAEEPEKAWDGFNEALALSVKLPVVFLNDPPSPTIDDPNTQVGDGVCGEPAVTTTTAPTATTPVKKKSQNVETTTANSTNGSHSTMFDASSVMSWIKLLAFIIIGGLAAYVAQIVDLKATSSSIFF